MDWRQKVAAEPFKRNLKLIECNVLLFPRAVNRREKENLLQEKERTFRARSEIFLFMESKYQV
jgi:hypothetical protein